VVRVWVDAPDTVEAKALARRAMRLLRTGGVPLPGTHDT
jgi:hypothetical protein